MKKLKKILLPLATAILVIAISIGATLAYLMDEATADNVMTIGKVDIELLEYERINTETKDADANVQEFRDNKPLLPAVIEKGFDYTPGDTYVDWTQDAVEWQQQNDDDGYTSPIWDPAKINNEVDKMVFLKNSGDYGAYVRIYFAFEAGAFTDYDEFRKMIHLNLNETDAWEWEWEKVLATNSQGGKYFIANATYKKELLPGDFTDITLSQIALDSTATNEQVAAFGDTYEVFVNAQGIQSAGFKTPDEALSEGFGEDFPFDNIYIEGVNLYTALHYLNGDAKGTKITSSVDSVTFGKNKDYLSIVNGYEGVHTNVEQESQVKTYYVPDTRTETDADGNVVKEVPMYDLYVLADGPIYTPVDSSNLFATMDWLINVNTENLDVSKTTNMYRMFYRCYRMQAMDTTNWNTSNVTNLEQAFEDCDCLATLNLTNWNVSNVTTFKRTFYSCNAINNLNVSNWNIGNVQSLRLTFGGCSKLETLDVSKWNTSAVTDMYGMFVEAQKINNLNVSKWNTSNVTNMEVMFAACYELEYLDISNWDVRKVTTFERFLAGYDAYKGVDDVYEMKIANLDFSKWVTSSAYGTDSQPDHAFSGMFSGCVNLTKLDLRGFNPAPGMNVSVSYMFTNCTNLVEVNLSGMNSEQVKATNYAFYKCPNLKTVYVGDSWKGIPPGTSDGLFTGCTSLQGGAGTAFDPAKTNKEYARIDVPAIGDTPAVPGYFTHISAKPADPEENQ